MALLVGDAFCTTKPESLFEAARAQAPELQGSPAYFTADSQQAARCIRKLASLHPRDIAPGHRRPLAGAALQEKLHRFAAEYSTERPTGRAAA